MGAKGVAITFVTSEEGKELTNIEKLINREVPVRDVPGFRPTRKAEAVQKEPEPQTISRLHAPVHSSTEVATAKLPAKTLGSRFRPKRGRRRL